MVSFKTVHDAMKLLGWHVPPKNQIISERFYEQDGEQRFRMVWDEGIGGTKILDVRMDVLPLDQVKPEEAEKAEEPKEPKEPEAKNVKTPKKPRKPRKPSTSRKKTRGA